MKILSVFGTRPEAIKMAPLVKALAADDYFESRVAVTAQHREMLDQVLKLFEIQPDYDLNLMRAGQDLYDVTAGALLGLRDVLKDFRPDLILVHGDTTTTLSASLAAFYQQIPVGHVEAGLRTGNMYSPWPEEANRVLTGRLAALHFAPTERNQKALLHEDISLEKIKITGNTVIDALQWVVKKIENSSEMKISIRSILEQAGLKDTIIDKRYVLITGHRRENFGEGFENICKALSSLAKVNPETHFIYPVHLNPNVQEPVKRLLGGLNNVHLIAPLSYEPFVYLMQHAYLVLTDSGGVQEEAPGLGKPVLVMRDTTERPEAVDAGTVKLVGTHYEAITLAVQELLDDPKIYQQMSRANNPYGDGFASQRIIDFIKENF
ncbi:UDP-N-acetylglucosamine 2-epimerase (non-hydrolyzing) [Acinetobacter sp. ACIN00229]|uniref:UDP-N-acetylglucosamine 2-epimerase n=1 Tax=Acinetobacter oleivorans (strain JCM 16667 / KCTC 23045 / DR1) TaxID=436717 RepID=A0AAN0UEZ0_ACISD|nr:MULTISPECIES: UDP-N-acetylglucosamine 2-epimerase (non-hydrolyzing) [Acinetobacter]ADI92701.1 UDP-N-acetylglucosamine 2-epimerase [Acinetobacter oleivorans DR1]ESK43925.1 UDP-N-acetylglucosamine 2-epimerase [Acinetobacter oleivorans CIP 110421]MBI0424076.1 UDP-N-acetylglucosamine 2-epimerase (non-hydrolyzing) [Acinetobacter sp. ACIN00229]MBJ9421727.1 UDP-N-acetylglucosamine 2-epimerase (non-hydrolyzing) [Acinetobacter oleivorans]WQF72887.1 UDP-N-acetylglucosamine 2-epimerase (non-hydrolyzin